MSSGEGQTGLCICPARKVLPRANYGIGVPAPETRHQHAAVPSQPAARIPLRIRQGLRLPRPLPSHSLNSSSRRLQGPSAALSSAYASEDFSKPLGLLLAGNDAPWSAVSCVGTCARGSRAEPAPFPAVLTKKSSPFSSRGAARVQPSGQMISR